MPLTRRDVIKMLGLAPLVASLLPVVGELVSFDRPQFDVDAMLAKFPIGTFQRCDWDDEEAFTVDGIFAVKYDGTPLSTLQPFRMVDS